MGLFEFLRVFRVDSWRQLARRAAEAVALVVTVVILGRLARAVRWLLSQYRDLAALYLLTWTATAIGYTAWVLSWTPRIGGLFAPLAGLTIPWPARLTVAITAGVAYVTFGAGLLARENRRRRIRRARWTVPLPDLGWPDDTWAVTKSRRELGAPCPGNHVLIGGMTRAGKSGAVNGLLYCLADLPVRFVAIDLKGGVELVHWWDRCDVVAKTHDEAHRVLEAVDALVQRRLDEMGGLKVKTSEGTDWPDVVVVIDELQELVSRSDEKSLRTTLESVARRGGATGVWLISATQFPSAEAIGSTYRAQHGVSVALRVRSRQDADVIAGQGVIPEIGELAESKLYVPWHGDISPPGRRDSGRALLVSDADLSDVRFVWRTDEAIAARAAATAHLAADPVLVMPPAGKGEGPSMEWTWNQLADEVERVHGHRPSDRRRTRKQDMLDLLTEEAA